MGVVIQGVIMGLVLSIYVGASFFTIIETSLRRGPAAAMILNTGVWASDVTIILLAYFGASGLISSFTEKLWILALAGIIFLIFGISYFIRKPKETIKPLSNNKKGVAVLFFKGFAINSFNPGVYIFWFGTMVMAASTFDLDGHKIFTYYASLFATVIFIDILKVLSSWRIRGLINDKLMSRLFKVTGVILIVFGFLLIAKSLNAFSLPSIGIH